MSPELFSRTRLRLALWYAGAFALVLVAFGLASYAALDRALIGQVDEADQQAAASMGEALQVQGGRLVIARDFEDEVHEAHATRGVAWVQVEDTRGRTLARLPARPPLGAPVRLSSRPIVRAGRLLGSLTVAHDMGETAALLARYRRGVAIAIPLALAGTCAVGYALAGMAIAPVRAAFEQQRRFLADASHELRTPLAILQTQAQVALEDPAPAATSLVTAMQAIDRSALRMGRLVDDLLFLSRSDAPTATLRPRGFFLDELVVEVLEDFAPVARSKGVDLTLARAPAELAVQADPEQLRRLLDNLVDNAIKFAARGHHGRRVQLALEARTDHTVHLAVQDSGPGIAAVDLPHVFERFYRADKARSAETPGSGLGLAIARAIATAHGGSLTARSAPGAGATFELVLPL